MALPLPCLTCRSRRAVTSLTSPSVFGIIVQRIFWECSSSASLQSTRAQPLGRRSRLSAGANILLIPKTEAMLMM